MLCDYEVQGYLTFFISSSKMQKIQKYAKNYEMDKNIVKIHNHFYYQRRLNQTKYEIICEIICESLPIFLGMSSITTQIEDDAQIHHHIAQSYASTSHPTAPPRAETPPPPYPGPTKDEVKGQSDQKINNQLKNRGKNVE